MSVPKRTYTVEGMTCAHCRTSVIDEGMTVDGVTRADVDLDKRLLTIAGEGFDDAVVSDAVDEAGFTLKR